MHVTQSHRRQHYSFAMSLSLKWMSIVPPERRGAHRYGVILRLANALSPHQSASARRGDPGPKAAFLPLYILHCTNAGSITSCAPRYARIVHSRSDWHLTVALRNVGKRGALLCGLRDVTCACRLPHILESTARRVTDAPLVRPIAFSLPLTRLSGRPETGRWMLGA